MRNRSQLQFADDLGKPRNELVLSHATVRTKQSRLKVRLHSPWRVRLDPSLPAAAGPCVPPRHPFVPHSSARRTKKDIKTNPSTPELSPCFTETCANTSLTLTNPSKPISTHAFIPRRPFRSARGSPHPSVTASLQRCVAKFTRRGGSVRPTSLRPDVPPSPCRCVPVLLPCVFVLKHRWKHTHPLT
jgi:hypothetical protein